MREANILCDFVNAACGKIIILCLLTPSRLESVGEGVVYFRSVRPPLSFFRSSSLVRTDLVTTISHERLEQSR